ncbi:MAG: hypothetical protein GQ565_03085 [Candidatus Aegiribacteria sp.]|nr:hypothetical protein [Candidatus Aegiribacteria sp.]
MTNQVALTTTNLPWTSLTAMTTASAATPSVANRAYAKVAEKNVATHRVFEPNYMHNALELRFSGTTNADSIVLDLLAARGQGDYYTRIATLTLTVGTQQRTGATDLFVDTIIVTNEYWLKPIKVVSDAGNYIARVILDKCGYNSFAIVPTTVAGSVIAEFSGF